MKPKSWSGRTAAHPAPRMRILVGAALASGGAAWDADAAAAALHLLERETLRCAGYCTIGPECRGRLHKNRSWLPPAAVNGETVATARALGEAMDSWWCALPSHQAFPTSFTVGDAWNTGVPLLTRQQLERNVMRASSGRLKGLIFTQVGKMLRSLAAAQAYALADSQRYRHLKRAAPARVDYGPAAAAFARGLCGN